MADVMQNHWAIWKQFVLQGVMQEDILPPALVQSWRRCATLGLDPYGEIEAKDVSDLAPTTVSHKLLSLLRPAMEDLHQFAEGAECVVVFADAELRIVDRVPDPIDRSM